MDRPEYHDDLENGIDYYDSLGVEVTASEAEIVSAFRARILTAHPDVGGDSDHASLLIRAKRTLTEPNRVAYDIARARKIQAANDARQRAEAARRPSVHTPDWTQDVAASTGKGTEATDRDTRAWTPRQPDQPWHVVNDWHAERDRRETPVRQAEPVQRRATERVEAMPDDPLQDTETWWEGVQRRHDAWWAEVQRRSDAWWTEVQQRHEAWWTEVQRRNDAWWRAVQQRHDAWFAGMRTSLFEPLPFPDPVPFPSTRLPDPVPFPWNGDAFSTVRRTRSALDDLFGRRRASRD